jgi:formate-dependent nitrite reductase membrane component NrfD
MLATVSALLGLVTTGMAAVLLVLCLRHRNDRKAAEATPGEGGEASSPWMIRDFRRLLVGAMIVQALTFFIWWISLKYGSADARGALDAANAAIGPLFWIVGIGLGLVVPIILQVQAMISSKRLQSLSMPLTILTAVLILIGGYVFRYAVVTGGQLY